MSRIGKKPITIEEGVTISIEAKRVKMAGAKGEVIIDIPDGLKIKKTDNHLEINSDNSQMSGLYRSLLNNAVLGVKNGWSKTLEMVGVGFRAQTDGSSLTLNLGFSHPVKIVAPKEISFSVSENKITVLGADKYLVGEIAAKIRRTKPPEPYKGKGIRYVGEYIRKKLGKAAKAVGGTTTTK